MQLRWLAIAALALAVAALIVWGLRHRAPTTGGGDAGAEPTDSFSPTPQQLRTFTIEAVAPHAFASGVVTDGRIASNADHTTSVYSPFSGRIVALDAGFGDSVTAGATLATLEATEYVQAQNDLAAARAQARAARYADTAALYQAVAGPVPAVAGKR